MSDISTVAHRSTITRIAAHALLIAAIVIVAFPILWAVKSSFTPTGEVLSTPVFAAPSRFTLENYAGGLSSAPFGLYFLNSTLIAVIVTATTVLAGLTAGYGFAKFDFKGKKALFVLVLGAMMMPFPAFMIPLFVETKLFGWLDSYAGLIIPGAVSAFGVFLMRQFLTGIPQELIEAARLDGVSEPGIFARIVVPLSKAPTAALATLTFVASWNNFLWPLIIVQNQALLTVPLGLAQFRGSNATDYGQMIAVSILGTLPVLVLFVVMRRHIVASFATSGIK